MQNELGFRILDTSLVLVGPRAALQPIATAYARFTTPVGELDGALRLVVDEASGRLRAGQNEWTLIPGLNLTFQIYQEFLSLVLQNVGSHAVLHGAALADGRGGSFVIAGPAGHGKTSLTATLLDRGYGFLGDDYAPLDLQARTIHPYPRAISMIPDSPAPVPRRFLDAAREPGVVRLFGKSLLDVGRLLGERVVVRDRLPLRHVILLGDPGPAEGRETLLDVAARSVGAREIEHALTAVPGAEVLHSKGDGELHRWQVRLEHARHPTRAVAAVLDRKDVVLCEKHWTERPVFDRSPQARPIKRREAAEFLGTELLNRRGGSRLLATVDGKVTRLFLELAGALCDASCWRLQTGRFSEMVDRIEAIVGART